MFSFPCYLPIKLTTVECFQGKSTLVEGVVIPPIAIMGPLLLLSRVSSFRNDFFNLFAWDLVEDSRLYLPSSYIRFTSETPGCCPFEGHKLNMATAKPAETNFVDTSLEELIKMKVIFIPNHGQTKSQKFGNLKTHIRAFPAAS